MRVRTHTRLLWRTWRRTNSETSDKTLLWNRLVTAPGGDGVPVQQRRAGAESSCSQSAAPRWGQGRVQRAAGPWGTLDRGLWLVFAVGHRRHDRGGVPVRRSDRAAPRVQPALAARDYPGYECTLPGKSICEPFWSTVAPRPVCGTGCPGLDRRPRIQRGADRGLCTAQWLPGLGR